METGLQTLQQDGGDLSRKKVAYDISKETRKFVIRTASLSATFHKLIVRSLQIFKLLRNIIRVRNMIHQQPERLWFYTPSGTARRRPIRGDSSSASTASSVIRLLSNVDVGGRDAPHTDPS